MRRRRVHHCAWLPRGGDLEWFDVPSLSQSESHGIRMQTRLEFKNDAESVAREIQKRAAPNSDSPAAGELSSRSWSLGSGHLIKNSGSSGETRRNSSSFPYIYESSSMHELAILCSSAHYIVCKLVSVCGAPNHSVNSTAFSREV